MIEREFLQDISKYKTKVIANLTGKELLCMAIALGVCIPVYHILSAYFIMPFCIAVCAVIGVPIMLCGFLEIYGLPIEKFVMVILKTMVFSSTSRKYKSKNEYEIFFADAMTDLRYSEKELKKIKKEEKKYKKQMKKEKRQENPELMILTPKKK